MNMKTIILTTFLFILLLLSGCSTTRVYNLNSFLTVSQENLKEDSDTHFKSSKVDDFIPLPAESVQYHESLIANVPYRNYLYIECIRFLQRDNALMTNKPIYVSTPTWNSWTKMFDLIFSFYSLIDNTATAKTMSCDLSIDNKKAVKEYQLKDFSLSLVKEEK